MRWGMPCRMKKKVTRTESRMEVEDILKMKLETIKEEDDNTSHAHGAIIKLRTESRKKKKKKNDSVMKIGNIFGSKRRLKDSYVLFMNGFATKGGLAGLPRY